MRFVYTISAIFALIALIAPVAALYDMRCGTVPNCVGHCHCNPNTGMVDCPGWNDPGYVDCIYHCDCVNVNPPPSPPYNARRPALNAKPAPAKKPLQRVPTIKKAPAPLKKAPAPVAKKAPAPAVKKAPVAKKPAARKAY